MNLEQSREKWYRDHVAYVIGVTAAIAIIFPSCSKLEQKELLDDCLKIDSWEFNPLYAYLLKKNKFLKFDSFTPECQELYTRGVADFIKSYLANMPISVKSAMFNRCLPSQESVSYWIDWHRLVPEYNI